MLISIVGVKEARCLHRTMFAAPIVKFCHHGLLLLVSFHSVAAFVAPSGSVGSTIKTTSVPVPSAIVSVSKPGEKTSLYVGNTHGSSSRYYSEGAKNPSRRINDSRLDTATTNNGQLCDVDAAFTTAISISYDPRADEQHMKIQRRKRQQAIAVAAALACALLLSQKVASAGCLPALLSKITYLYMAYPLKASVATCSVNTVLADALSQLRVWKKSNQGIFQFQWRQQLSTLVYGASILGIGTNLVYTKLLPTLFPLSAGVKSIVASAVMDNFVFAPLVWLPPAYMLKSLFAGKSARAGLQTYKNDIFRDKLLLRYWTVWIPAQIFTFAVVPKHLRVVSTNIFSFCWFLILTSITSKK